MSKQVDERVVSMQFDNKHFESNVQTTMSTLDKLKQKLNLSGASKGLEDVNAAAKKTDMSALANGVETVRAKFSALQVMGVTALANITNSAVNAGKRIAHSLTIQPITTGFNEYELKMNSIQTIMASTGEKLSTVNDYLEELNTYSDKTIYSFSDMTQNIGKFTNAGVKLEDAVMAIKGISNEAAVSGANANEASRAMYNFAQALSAGYVKLIDWKSIELANMATKEFKEQLIQSAVAAGTLTETSDGMYKTLKGNTLTATKNFNETLSDQWMTTEVLIGTLKDYADENTEIGKKAFAAAQDVKTFSMMLDTLKESAQSGWAKTWEIMFGDLEEAKKLWTGLTNFIGGFIDKMSNARNAVLESALGKTFSKLKEQVSAVNKPLGKAAKSVEKVTKVAKDYSKVVDEIIKGDWGNTEKRWNALTKAGYDWAHAQNLVNEKLGVSKRYTTEYDDSQKKLNKTQKESKETNAELIAKYAEMSDYQLKNLGYTDKQIQAFRDLAEAAERIGMPLEEFIKNIDEIDGRWLVINSFKNIWEEISKIFEKVGEAWKNVFGEFNAEDTGNSLYGLIEQFHKITESMEISEESAENFKKVMEGLFSLFQLTGSIASMSVVGALKILNALLDLFGTNILEVAGRIGEMITNFNKWLKENTLIGYGTQWKKIAEILKVVIEGVTKCTKAFWALSPIQDIVSNISDAFSRLFSNFNLKGFDLQSVIDCIEDFFTNIENWILDLENSENIGKDIIQGLINGIWSGIKKLGSVLWELGTTIITTICDILGIHSPSTVMIAIGGFIILGLTQGIANSSSFVFEAIRNVISRMMDIVNEVIQNGIPYAVDLIKNLGSKISESISSADIDLRDIFVAGGFTSLIVIFNKLVKVLDKFANPFDKFGDLLGGLGSMFTDIGQWFDAKKWEIRANGILTFAKAIAVLAASLFIISKIDPDRLWASVGALAALAGIITVLSLVVGSLAKLEKFSFGKSALMIVTLSVSLIFLAGAMKILSTINGNDMETAIAGLIAVVVGVIALLTTLRLVSKGQSVIEHFGGTLIKISIAMLLLAAVIKVISKLDGAELLKGSVIITGFLVFMNALAKVTKGTRANIKEFGSTVLKVSFAIMLLVACIKLIGTLSLGELVKGSLVIAGFTVLIKQLVDITKGTRQNIKSVGTMLLQASAAMILMATTIRILGGMSIGAIAKGMICVALFGQMMIMFVREMKTIQQDLPKVGAAILAMSVSIGILAGVTLLCSLMSIEGLVKGLTAVSILAIMFSIMAKSLQGVNEVKGTVMNMAIAIGVMAGALALLSLIDSTKLAVSVAALSSVMGMFAVMLLSIKSLHADTKSVITTLISLTVVVALLGGIIYGLSTTDTGKAIESAVALSALMMAMATCMYALNKVQIDTSIAGKILALSAMTLPLLGFTLILQQMSGVKKAVQNATALIALAVAMTGLVYALSVMSIGPEDAANMVVGILALSAMTLPLLGFTLILQQMSGVENATKNALALSILAGALTLLLLPLCLVGALLASTAGIVAFGIVALLLMVVPLMSFVGVLAKMNGIENAKSNAELLTNLMNTLTETLVKVSLLGPLALVGVGAITALTSVMTRIGALAVIVGNFESIGPALDKGMDILIRLSAGLGEIIGSFISGIGVGISSGLPTIGKNLSEFMKNAEDFIKGANGIKDSLCDKIKILIEAIGLITVNGIFTDIFGGSITTFSAGIVELGKAINKFSEEINTINSGKVNTAVKAINKLSKLEIPRKGLMEFLTNKTLYSDFTEGIVPLGEALDEFSSAVEYINTDAVKAAAKAIKTLADLEIPKKGFFASFSEKHMFFDFAEGIVPLGEALDEFSYAVEDVDTKAIKAAAKAFKLLADVEVPKKGIFDSANKTLYSDFTEGIVPLGESLTEFSYTVEDIDDKAVKAAADALKSLTEMAENIPEKGLFDDKDYITNFADDIEPLGKAISKFNDSVEDVDAKAVKAAAKALETLADIQTTLSEIENSSDSEDKLKILTEFSGKLEEFGESLYDFSAEVEGVDVDQITSVANAANSIAKLAKTVSALDTKGAENEDAKSKLDSLSKFSGELSSFGEKLSEFYDTLMYVKPERLQDIADAAVTLAKVVETLPGTTGEDGEKSKLKSLSTFIGELESFGTELKKFSNSLGTKFDSKSVTAAATAASDLASVLDSLPSTKGDSSKEKNTLNSLSTFIDELEPFGEKLQKFSNKVKGFNSGDATKAITAATDMASILDSLPKTSGTIESAESKVLSFSKFIGQIGLLGDSMKNFSEDLDGVENIDTVVKAAQAAAKLATIVEYIPAYKPNQNANNVLTGLCGFINCLYDPDMPEDSFAGALKGFSDKIGTSFNTDGVTAAASAAVEIAKIMEVLPASKVDETNTNKLNSLKQFIDELIPFGQGLQSFEESVGSDDFNSDKVIAAATAAVKLANVFKTLSEATKGLSSGHDALTPIILPIDQLINALAPNENGVSLGSALDAFYKDVKDIKTDGVLKVITIANKLSELANALPKDSSSLSNFATNLDGLGSTLATYISDTSGIVTEDINRQNDIIDSVKKVQSLDSAAVKSAATAIEDLTTALTTVGGISEETATGFKTAIETIGKTGVKTLIAAFDNSHTQINKAAATAMGKAVEGMKSKLKAIKTACTTILTGEDSAITAINSCVSNFKSAGGDLVAGLVKGITSKESLQKAYDAGYKLGKEAVRGEKDGQESQSPSKATERAGKWLGEGLVIGIDKMGKAVYNSGKSMGKTAVNSISKAISNISDIVNSDIDSQPTIRPVLDLSDVKSGAGAINGMLSGRSISLDTSSVGVISASMAGFQNGNNSHEIVSSIKALRKDIANMPRESTVINGITYDDGSNITEAVQTLVRAAKIERRT